MPRRLSRPEALRRKGCDLVVSNSGSGRAGRARRVVVADRARAAAGHGPRSLSWASIVKLQDALPLVTRLKHAGIHHGCRVNVRWLARRMSSTKDSDSIRSTAIHSHAVSAPLVGGNIPRRRVARERGIPYLGISLGMHVAISAFARHDVGLAVANSTERIPRRRSGSTSLTSRRRSRTSAGRCASAPSRRARQGIARRGLASRSRVSGTGIATSEPPFPAGHRAGRPVVSGVPEGASSRARAPRSTVFVASHSPEFQSRRASRPLFRDFVGAPFPVVRGRGHAVPTASTA